MPLVAGPAVVDANHVNVRGQPKLKSEVITRLTKGQSVVVVEEITRNNSGPDEPSAWAKILLPTNTHVWVSTAYIDPTNKTVLPKKLNLRGGPGENYSVLGRLLRGETVTNWGRKGTGLEIEAPTNAFAFMAAQYLKQERRPARPRWPTVVPEPTPTTAAENPSHRGRTHRSAGPPTRRSSGARYQRNSAEAATTNTPPARRWTEPPPNAWCNGRDSCGGPSASRLPLISS